MSDKYLDTLVSTKITRGARNEFEGCKGTRQALSGAIDDYIASHHSLLKELEDMERKQMSIPDDLMEKLKARQKPHQALAGVIEELLCLAERVEKAQTPTIPYADKAIQQ